MLSKSHRVHSAQFLYGHKNTVNHYLRTLQSAAVTGWKKKKKKDIRLTQAMCLFTAERTSASSK